MAWLAGIDTNNSHRETRPASQELLTAEVEAYPLPQPRRQLGLGHQSLPLRPEAVEVTYMYIISSVYIEIYIYIYIYGTPPWTLVWCV